METTHELNPPLTEHTPALLSKSELAEELHKSCRTIEIWVKAGYISCIKVGRSVFFDRDQVMADLRRFQIGPKTGY